MDAQPQPKAQPEAEQQPGPALHRPDYGHALRRGGSRVEFSLHDAGGEPVPAHLCEAALWRKLGEYWLREDCELAFRTNLLRCFGMGENGVPPAGLEPGDYELDLHSHRYGGLRHRFSVGSSESRQERLTLPNWTRVICFRFVHADGTPVLWLRSPPTVNTISPRPIPIDHPGAPMIAFRRPPTEEPVVAGSGGSGSERFTQNIRRRPETELYPTDAGRYYVRVFAGAECTVRFALGSIWGREEYAVTSNFTDPAWEETVVTLNTVADFADRVASMRKRDADPPGGKLIIEADAHNELPQPSEPVDPATAPMRQGEGRFVLDVTANFEARVLYSSDGRHVSGAFASAGGGRWYLATAPGVDRWFCVTDGLLYASAWEKVSTMSVGMVVTESRHFHAEVIDVHCGGLSPTLQAFAHTVDFDLGLVGDMFRDDKRAQRSSHPRIKVPEGGTNWVKLTMHQRDGATTGQIRLGPESLTGVAAGATLTTRAHLRGVARGSQHDESSRNGEIAEVGGPMVSTLLTLDGAWQKHEGDIATLLRGGTIQPHFDRAFCLRAVGDGGEGLPWVQGLVIEHGQDDTASQVRAVLARRRLEIKPESPSAYAVQLQQAVQEPTETRLRALLGDTVFEAFETDAQRLWFARNGAWYDVARPVRTDDHGYVATQDLTLEPGKVYELYLWSRSRDASYPDARIVFEAGPGVTDLGVIRLPSYR